jgi:hypothetical protein
MGTALRMLTRARRLAPTSIAAHVNLGEAYLRAGLIERALETFGVVFDGALGRFSPRDPQVRRARVLAAAACHTLRKMETRRVDVGTTVVTRRKPTSA